LSFFNQFYYSTFNYQTKKRLLALNDNLGFLLEKHLKEFKSEERFWKEFIENQRKYETELFGSYSEIYMADSELRSEEFEKMRIQREILKQSEQNKYQNNFNLLKKLGRKYENFELNNNYSHKNDGISLNVNEFDFKDKEIKMVNLEEPSDRKDITNFIYKLNDYSARKLSSTTFINKRLMETKIKKSIFNNYSQVNNINREDIIHAKESGIHNQILNNHVMEENIRNNDPTKNISHQTSKNVNQYKKNYKENMGNEYLNNKINGKWNDNNINQEKTTHNKKSNFYSNKINEMKHKYLLEKAHQATDCYNKSQDSMVIFNKINEITAKTGKTNPEIKRREELNLIIEIFNKHEIIKDIYVINNFLKGSSYSDQIKNQKRNLVKSLTFEIENSKNNMKQNRNLTNSVKVNLELLNLFLNKIKPNTNVNPIQNSIRNSNPN